MEEANFILDFVFVFLFGFLIGFFVAFWQFLGERILCFLYNQEVRPQSPYNR